MQALDAYAQHVVDVEWPAMALGQFGPTLETAHDRDLWQAVNDAGTRAADRHPTYEASLEQLDDLDVARRNRVLLGEDAVPQPMTLTLIIGAVVTVGFSYLFAVDDGWMHGLMTAALATLVALLLLLEYQLETPYRRGLGHRADGDGAGARRDRGGARRQWRSTVSDDQDIAFLLSAPNEPMARFWEQVLVDAGIPVLVRPGGPGAGGWGSVATFAHDLYVRQADLDRAREIVADDDGAETGDEE